MCLKSGRLCLGSLTCVVGLLSVVVCLKSEVGKVGQVTVVMMLLTIMDPKTTCTFSTRRRGGAGGQRAELARSAAGGPGACADAGIRGGGSCGGWWVVGPFAKLCVCLCVGRQEMGWGTGTGHMAGAWSFNNGLGWASSYRGSNSGWGPQEMGWGMAAADLQVVPHSQSHSAPPLSPDLTSHPIPHPALPGRALTWPHTPHLTQVGLDVDKDAFDKFTMRSCIGGCCMWRQ